MISSSENPFLNNMDLVNTSWDLHSSQSLGNNLWVEITLTVEAISYPEKPIAYKSLNTSFIVGEFKLEAINLPFLDKLKVFLAILISFMLSINIASGDWLSIK